MYCIRCVESVYQETLQVTPSFLNKTATSHAVGCVSSESAPFPPRCQAAPVNLIASTISFLTPAQSTFRFSAQLQRCQLCSLASLLVFLCSFTAEIVKPKKRLQRIGCLARLIDHQLFRIAGFVSALSVLDLGGFVSLLEHR